MKKHILRSAAVAPLFLVVAAIVLGAASCATPRAALPQGAGPQAGAPRTAPAAIAEESVPFTKSVRTGVLPNGMRYYLRENRWPKERAVLRLFVNAGSVAETEEERGLAHFVEHMAFNGTVRFPKNTLVEYLRSLGMRFGPELNARTSFDETVYGLEVPTEPGADGRRAIPRTALEIMDDWTHAVLFDPAEVAAERGVILEEWRGGLGAQDRVRRILLPALFRGSPYAQRLPIGLPEIIRAAPSERLRSFYKKWYRPDNMAFVAVGDFDAVSLESSLAGLFGAAAPASPLVRVDADLPPPEAGRLDLAIATDAELTGSFVQLAFKRSPAPRSPSVAEYRRSIVESLVDRMLGLRFLEMTGKQETPFTAAGSGTQRYGKTARFFMLSAIPETASVTETLRALFRVKESLSAEGFAADEIEAAKRSYRSDAAKYLSEKDKRESVGLAEELGRHFLRGEPVPDVEWEIETIGKILDEVDKDEINAVIQSLFAPGDLIVLISAPEAERSSLPDVARVRELAREIEHEVAAAIAAERPSPEERSGDEPGMDIVANLSKELPTPGQIVREAYDAEHDIRVWDLSNGARVILKPTDNKNDEIVFSAGAKGGRTSASDADAVSAAFAAGMAERSGIGPYSLTRLARALSGRQAELSYGIGDYSRGFSGSSTSADLETLLAMLHYSFSAPRIDAEASAAYLERIRTQYAQRAENPEAVFADRVTSIVTGGHPRFAPLDAEKVARADPMRADSFLRAGLQAAEFTFAFAGNIDVERMRTLVPAYIGSLAGGGARRPWIDLGMRRPAATDAVVRKGSEAKASVFQARYLPTTNDEMTAVQAEALSEYLDIVMIREIREKLGGVYSISVSVGLGVAPRPELSLIVRFSCDPARVDELYAAVDKVLDSVASGEIEADTFEKTVLALKKQREQALQDNNFIAAVLVSLDLFHERPLSRLYGYGTRYDELKPTDLSLMARALLNRDRVRVVLLPAE